MAPAVLESRRSARGLLSVLATGFTLLTINACENPVAEPLERSDPDREPVTSFGAPPLTDRAMARLGEDDVC